ncbi:hypothetical protein QCA50_005421 [Cerrena zonata]|uniref:Uncharacterized protein n=1 Tax=Cerrena zonata TaxID=2478898 RepID=A0AAW0GF55_9APHY
MNSLDSVEPPVEALIPSTELAEVDERTEMIEQIFARVEEESARRAQQEAEAEAVVATLTPQEASESQDDVPNPLNTVSTVRQRRRGSVSVSRFGEPTELSPEPILTTSTTPSNRASRSSSVVIQKATFYSVQPQQHGSADSLASETASDPAKLVEDIHSTKMATISGRQSLSKAITRRLSRARSRSKEVLITASNINTSVVIDVAVTEATVEVHHSDEEDEEARVELERPKSSAAVYSPNTLKSQRSTSGLRILGEKEKTSGKWVTSIKDLGARWRRKSLAVLSPSS